MVHERIYCKFPNESLDMDFCSDTQTKLNLSFLSDCQEQCGVTAITVQLALRRPIASVGSSREWGKYGGQMGKT